MVFCKVVFDAGTVVTKTGGTGRPQNLRANLEDSGPPFCSIVVGLRLGDTGLFKLGETMLTDGVNFCESVTNILDIGLYPRLIFFSVLF